MAMRVCRSEPGLGRRGVDVAERVDQPARRAWSRISATVEAGNAAVRFGQHELSGAVATWLAGNHTRGLSRDARPRSRSHHPPGFTTALWPVPCRVLLLLHGVPSGCGEHRDTVCELDPPLLYMTELSALERHATLDDVSPAPWTPSRSPASPTTAWLSTATARACARHRQRQEAQDVHLADREGLTMRQNEESASARGARVKAPTTPSAVGPVVVLDAAL
jgi:hypothetical protein